MKGHFDYLLAEDEAEFFQKVACDVTPGPVATAPPHVLEKTAAAYALEKVAGRVANDLYILKTAGACGVNLGMVKRADAYIDRLMDEVEFTPEVFEQVFDKVAGTAIDTDIEAARRYFHGQAPVELHPWIDGELAKVGQALVQAAQMEKEALVGALGALGRAAKTVGAVGPRAAAAGAARGASKRLTNLSKSPVMNTVKRNAAGARAAAESARHARTTDAARQMTDINKRIQSATSIKNPNVRAGALENLNKRRNKAQDRLGKKVDEGWDSPPATAKAPAAATAAKSSKTEASRQRAANEAASAAKSKGKPKSTATPASEPARAAGNVAEGAAPGLLATMKKAKSEGWGSLSQAEKQKLINAGVAGALGFRVATGHGAVTGGEGLI